MVPKGAPALRPSVVCHDDQIKAGVAPLRRAQLLPHQSLTPTVYSAFVSRSASTAAEYGRCADFYEVKFYGNQF
jgi:hypothetical protein